MAATAPATGCVTNILSTITTRTILPRLVSIRPANSCGTSIGIIINSAINATST